MGRRPDMDKDEEVNLDKSLRNLFFDGLASQIMFSLLTVSIVTSYLASSNASPILIGLVASLPYLSQMIQLPSALFAEKISRKRVSLLANAISRFSLLAIALVILSGDEIILSVAFFAVYNIFKELSTVSWSSWMRDLIPGEIRGSFYARRIAYGKLIALFAVLAFTAIFNLFGKLAFPLLFFNAFTAGIISLWFISKIDDIPVKEKTSKSLKEPLKDGNFLRFVSATSLWRFSSEMALPFYSVYIIAVLHYPVWFVIALSCISQLSSTYFLRISGSIMDRFGHKPVIALSSASFSISAILFTFTTLPEKHTLTLPILVAIYIMDGFYTSIPPLAIMNTIAKITPRGSSASYYAFGNVINSVFGALGSLTGGILATFLTSANFALKIDIESSLGFLEIFAVHLASYDFLFLISAFLSLISAKLLRFFREENASSEEEVKKEIRNAVLRDIQVLAAHMHLPLNWRYGDSIIRPVHSSMTVSPQTINPHALTLHTGISENLEIGEGLQKGG